MDKVKTLLPQGTLPWSVPYLDGLLDGCSECCGLCGDVSQGGMEALLYQLRKEPQQDTLAQDQPATARPHYSATTALLRHAGHKSLEWVPPGVREES